MIQSFLGASLHEYPFYSFVLFSLYNAFNMFTDFIAVAQYYYILKFKENLLLVSAFGLSFTYTYFIMFFMFGFSEYIGIEGCKLLAARKHAKFKILIAQLLTIFAVLSLVTITLGLSCDHIFRHFGFEEKLINISAPFIKSNLPERLLEPLKQMVLNLIIYFERQSTFIPIFSLSLLQFLITTALFTYVIDLGLYGYTIARFLKTLLEFYLLWKVFKQAAPAEVVGMPDFRNINKNFKSVLKNCLFSLVTVYGEGISNEMTTFFVMRIDSLQQQATWVLFSNINYFLLVFGVGQGQTFRSKLNELKGTKQLKKIKTLIKVNYKFCFVVNIIASILIYAFKKPLSQLLTLDIQVQQNLERLLSTYVFFICFYINKFSIGSLVRSMGYFGFTSILSGVFYPLAMFICFVVAQNYFGIQIFGFQIIYFLVDFGVYVSLTAKFLLHLDDLKNIIDLDQSLSYLGVPLVNMDKDNDNQIFQFYFESQICF